MVRQGVYDLKTGFLALNASEAHAVLDRIFTINLSCLVFTFGILLVAIQVAGGQYTPRIIATTLLRDNVIRYIVGLFVFTLPWTNRMMLQPGELADAPQFQIFLAMASHHQFPEDLALARIPDLQVLGATSHKQLPE